MFKIEKQLTFKILTIISILISLLNKSKVDSEFLDRVDNSFIDYNNNNISDLLNNHQQIFSRKRRYLIFPEGSSLQVVFDEIIPIVDYNNFLILGLTVALAWELPSKPPSELLQDVQEKLNDGTLGHRKDILTLKYTDNSKIEESLKSKVNHVPRNYYYSPHEQLVYNPSRRMHYLRSIAQPYGNYYRENNLQTKFNYFENSSWYSKENYNSGQHNYLNENRQGPHTWRQSPWIKFNKRKSYILHDHQYARNSCEYNAKGQQKHRVNPVFGTRSAGSRRLNIEQKFNLKYHRNTRHAVYIEIVKYLNSQGNSGLYCVLKVLCLTGKSKNEIVPGSFIREIIRAVFTFPQNYENIVDEMLKMYDDAHSHKGNCNERYPECSHTLWENELFV